VAPPPRTAASGRSTRANSSAPVPCARQSAGPAPLLPSTRPMGPATWSEGTAPVARPCDRGRRRVRLGLHRPPQTALAVRQQEQRHSLTAGQEALRAARGRAGVGPRVGPTGRPRQREHPDLQKQPSGRQDLNLRPFDPQDMGVGPAPGPGFNEARAEERDPCSSCHRVPSCGPNLVPSRPRPLGHRPTPLPRHRAATCDAGAAIGSSNGRTTPT